MKYLSLPLKAEIVELPVGATAVDLAYAVHTDIGNSCVGARVDRNSYPLSHPLENGQTVEIITAYGARPNATWLNYVVTSRARTKIRHVLKQKQRSESIALGKRLLNHSLGNQSLSDFDTHTLSKVLSEFKLSSIDDALAQIGSGELISLVIAKRLLGEEKIDSAQGSLAIQGTEGILLTYANCCRPIPGDPIIAYISPGKGLVIHREECSNIRDHRQEAEKYLDVEWCKNITQDFTTSLRIFIQNNSGMLAELTSIIAKAGSNIIGLSTEERDGKLYTVKVRLTTKDRIHLANIMRRIRVMPNVVKIQRKKS